MNFSRAAPARPMIPCASVPLGTARTYYARSAPSVKRLLTTRQAAEYLAVSERTVCKLRETGELRGLKIRGCRRYDLAELARLVDAVSPPAQTEPITERQLRALHAKAGDLDRKLGVPRGTSKRQALELTPRLLGRHVRSARELTVDEASVLLDALEARLEEHAFA